MSIIANFGGEAAEQVNFYSLHTPQSVKDCNFCNLKSEDILWETDTSLVMAASQFRHGHLVVVLKRHVEELTELSSQENARFCNDLLECAKVVKRVFRPDKVNYSLLGNWADHLHWHIYPRYTSDPDFGQPMVMHWRVNGERVMPPRVELKEQPLTPDEKKRLRLALEAAFSP